MIEIANPKFRPGKSVAMALLTILAACTFGLLETLEPRRANAYWVWRSRVKLSFIEQLFGKTLRVGSIED